MGFPLSDTDSCVLAVLCKIAVRADRDFFVEDAADHHACRAERLDANALLRAIRFLEEVRYVRGLFQANMPAREIPQVRVFREGFDRLYKYDPFRFPAPDHMNQS
jgi:hypothetical protein